MKTHNIRIITLALSVLVATVSNADSTAGNIIKRLDPPNTGNALKNTPSYSGLTIKAIDPPPTSAVTDAMTPPGLQVQGAVSTPTIGSMRAPSIRKDRSPGSNFPKRTLPTDKQGVPTTDINAPHTQLGRSKDKYGAEPQAREWDYGSNGKLQPKKDIDFTDHGYPNAHPDVPHQHKLTPNNPDLAPIGGYRRGKAEPL